MKNEDRYVAWPGTVLIKIKKTHQHAYENGYVVFGKEFCMKMFEEFSKRIQIFQFPCINVSDSTTIVTIRLSTVLKK